jgi:hypothetical protein
MFQWYVRNPPGRINSQEGTIKEQGRTDQHFPIAMH